MADAQASRPGGDGLAIGSELGGYRIERLVGCGGMGAVYEATQLSLQRRVALKVISRALDADEGFRDRFRREARAAAAVEHPNLLPVYEAGELPDGSLFTAVRFVDGYDLESRLRTIGPLAPAEALAILGQVADALDGAHTAGLIHRDVKPANVLLEERGVGVHAYLADFGLVKEVGHELGRTETGQLLGTVDYMAPEQIAGEDYDAKVDVYAFGAMAYRALAGSVPYRRETPAATLVAHREAAVPRPSDRTPGLPSAFDELVARAMAKDPAERASAAGELMRDLGRTLEASGVAVADESPTVVEAFHEAGAAARDGERKSLARQTALYIAVFAPIWAAAYFIGRSIT